MRRKGSGMDLPKEKQGKKGCSSGFRDKVIWPDGTPSRSTEDAEAAEVHEVRWMGRRATLK